MDNFLEDVSRTTPCSDCRHVLSDMKQMREQMTFLTHQIVQLMQVLCINNCRCVTCQSFIGSSKLFSKVSRNFLFISGSIGNGFKNCQIDLFHLLFFLFRRFYKLTFLRFSIITPRSFVETKKKSL